MLPHRSFVGVLACLGALFAFPPLLRLTLQARPATHTVEVQYWALHPASRDSRQLKVAFLTFVGPCVPERAFLRWLAKEDGLAPDLTLGGLDMLSCHEGNEAHGDARALHHASVSTSGMGAFSCAAVPTEKWLGWHDAFRQDCVYLKDVDINLFNVRVQLSLFDDFQGGSPITWGPVTDPRYRNIMELPERQGVPVLEPAPAPCDDRTPALHANLCLRGSKPSFVAASAKFSEAWIPETIVLQFQVRMLHCFRPGKEGGPIGARIMQALSSDPAVMPASIELSVDWNRINTNTELPTVWVNFRLPGATKILSSFTFTARLLEDCRSHVLSVLIRSDGYCVLSIDGDERARFAMVGTPGWRVDAMMSSAALAAVQWANATATDGAPELVAEANNSAGEHGYLMDWEKILVKPFFNIAYDTVAMSGWGVVPMANGETTFEAMPWGFDNLYVGESPADAISHLQRTFYPVRDIERGLPECPFLPY